ncbi:MAG: lysine--tRNA ligase [Candidatus Harrisonbacteria bacterium RIFCSPLOWO2_02_FULL_45_10c]|uniref:Lysine--tRNA ligase n=1 Tax=Candidatus Harrisonbacteria bacterium RIFCSPLOWO2_02_FULL_45_10c TaxID=1798410 RepID=A0A1G1ZWF8_9BACT|nr:MAG: lysine--tRNA ligase [Candidatus Harrisonbacteria bacterium RIFCSPLOWO2_02_FULL_45_10c]
MLDDIIKERIKKRDILIRAGYAAYPSKVPKQRAIAEVVRHFLFLSIFRRQLIIGGRIIGMRAQGSVLFLDIKDGSGKLQAVLNKKRTKDFAIFKDTLDLGDFVAVSGTAFKTKKGERSINVNSLTVLVKSLRPLPSEWYGLKDVEERYRKRYLDLLTNSEVREKLLRRSEIVSELRCLLETDGFLEVETPMLQPLPGGALARPFKTHHNALDADFYLRIAPELYLKRLLVGGMEKIFEIGRNFRNEGMDREHNPEFTMLELYWAYQDYEGLMAATQRWLLSLMGRLGIASMRHENQTILLANPWPRRNYADLIREYSGKELKDLKVEEIDEIFKKEVRPKLINPTFVIRYPKAISPLAKSCADNPELTERFQLIIAGTELVNGFSELNDPMDQRQRMEEQEKMHRAGNEEASRLDEDFLEALEYGMPPAAGLGIGIDRLAALLTDSHSLKDIILFPTLRPKD